MISFPNAKINLGLNITTKRDDGFHELESVFYPVNWKDVLEITPREDDKINFKVEGMSEHVSWGEDDLATDQEIASEVDPTSAPPKNLCEKAYELMQDKFDIPGADILLKKHIPVGAGLGGGSSDASFTLKMVNDLYELKLDSEKLQELSSILGSDCPFFIENRPMFVTGRGEKMKPVDLKLSRLYIILIYPGLKVSTKWAYSNIVPKKPDIDLQLVIEQEFSDWKKYLKNDFEPIVTKERPYIAKQIGKLYDHGALYSAMSGSGSTVFGIFPEFPEGFTFGPDDIHVTLLL